MRLQALKCKCCFPHVIKEELTSAYIIQGAEYQFYLRWDKKLAARKKKNLFQRVSICEASPAGSDPSLQGRGMCMALQLYAVTVVWTVWRKNGQSRDVILWLWSRQPVLFWHSARVFLHQRGKQERCWGPFPFSLPRGLLRALFFWQMPSKACNKLLLHKCNGKTTLFSEMCLKTQASSHEGLHTSSAHP